MGSEARATTAAALQQYSWATLGSEAKVTTAAAAAAPVLQLDTSEGEHQRFSKTFKQ